MKTCLLFLFAYLLCISFNTAGQNLVPNPSFEILQRMPVKGNSPVECANNWITVFRGSDYYNRAAAGRRVGVPKNIFGKQQPNSGKAYAGICIQKKWIEYIETKLTTTLIKGEDYLVEFYISRADRSVTSVNEFGVVFTNKVVRIFDNISKGIPRKPSLDFTNSEGYNNKKDWTKLSGVYRADGTENVLILGYFNYDHPEGYKGFCHYYIDDVSVSLIKKKDPSVSLKITDSIAKPFSPKLGETITLKNIFFALNKSELLPESFLELDKLVQYLIETPNTSIKINGHTDNTGTEEQNKILSEARAKAVADYLILKGIDKSRINYSGYGSLNPIATNFTEEGKQQNRRVDFIINKN